MSEYKNRSGEVIANDDTEALIEARHPDHGNNWDSDYVGNDRITIDDAVAHVKQLRNLPEWDGWEFRILARVDDAYEPENEIEVD